MIAHEVGMSKNRRTTTVSFKRENTSHEPTRIKCDNEPDKRQTTNTRHTTKSKRN